MSCSGSCFDIGPLSPISEPEPQWAIVESLSTADIDHKRDEDIDGTDPLYSLLKPWQTRLLRLPSAEEFSFKTSKRLKAKLVVVDLPVIEGAVVVSEQRIVHYTALSYTWGDPPIGHTLLCQGHELSITANLATALSALQHPVEEVFVWVDAVCINQDDKEELQEQVVKMLQIYQKAEKVLGWLGAANPETTLAMFCIRSRRVLEDRIQHAKPWEFHSPDCQASADAILYALTSLLERPWLSRTWVRQEIYGARKLNVQCGSQMLDWSEFASAAGIIRGFAKAFDELKLLRQANVATALDLVSEAKRNRVMLQPRIKVPRSLSEVLLMSKHFGVGKAQDTVYGVLGMCAAASSSGSNDQSTYEPNGEYVIGVDYSKPVADVYLDAALHLLSTKRLESLVDLWNYYARSPRHEEGMPTWVTDWRDGVIDKEEGQTIQKALEGPTKSSVSAAYEFISSLIPVSHGEYIYPEPTQENPRVLNLTCKVINYIAYVSDFTTDLKSFVLRPFAVSKLALTMTLGHAATSIHSAPSPERGHFLFDKPPGIPFQKGTHSRRLAILGMWPYGDVNGSNAQLALVPATVRKGDLVVAVGPKLLPLLLRPLQSRAARPGLYSDPDPYEEASHILRPASHHSSHRAPGSDWEAIRRRKQEIRAILDEASAIFGTDYEFHGPVISIVASWENVNLRSRIPDVVGEVRPQHFKVY